jgi:hypothetical protein
LSNKIYAESNGTEVGLSLVYFTRDTMGIGPVGADGTPPLMHCYKYDASSPAHFGNMYEVLKQVKSEPEPLPKMEDEESDETERGGEDGEGGSGSSTSAGEGKKEDLPTPLQIELGGWNH